MQPLVSLPTTSRRPSPSGTVCGARRPWSSVPAASQCPTTVGVGLALGVAVGAGLGLWVAVDSGEIDGGADDEADGVVPGEPQNAAISTTPRR